MTVTELSGDKVQWVPDIQVTAIRLKDSRILGQASSSEFLGQGTAANWSVRQFGVHEITEATALAISERPFHEPRWGETPSSPEIPLCRNSARRLPK